MLALTVTSVLAVAAVTMAITVTVGGDRYDVGGGLCRQVLANMLPP